MDKLPQNIQEAFLNTARKEKIFLTIYLMSGVKLSGRIKSFDKYSVVLETNSQEQLIFKHAISTVVLSKSSHSSRVPHQSPAPHSSHSSHSPQPSHGSPAAPPAAGTTLPPAAPAAGTTPPPAAPATGTPSPPAAPKQPGTPEG